MPPDANGRQPNTENWLSLDGFSLSAAILTSWPGVVDLSNVAPHWRISDSLNVERSALVLVDYDTGDIIPHWGEIDESSNEGPGTYNRTFMVWPARSYGNERHVVVGFHQLRNADKSGELFEASPAFAALRDNTPSQDPLVNGRREYYDDLFKVLDKATGIDRSAFQLVFDFTTASRESVNGYVLEMRQDMYKHVDKKTGPAYDITSIEENPSQYTARRIEGVMTVPLYLKRKLPGTTLNIGSKGLPEFNGFANYSFTVQIPRSLVDNKTSGGLLHYGHGLFGTQGEVKASYLQKFGFDHGLTTFATDWVGMASYDVPSVITMLTSNFANFRIIPDGLSQAMVNHLLLTELMMGDFASDPNTIFGGVPTINPEKGISYQGSSNGGILGTTYMSLETNIERGCVDVPGGPYALLLPRSVDFEEFRAVLTLRWRGSHAQMFLIDWIQSLWDRAAPGGYMHLVTDQTFPGTPRKQILIHDAVHDSQVSYVGGAMLARSMNAKIFAGNYVPQIDHAPAEQYDLPVIPAGKVESGPGAVYQTFFFDTPEQPSTNAPPTADCDTHSCPRKDSRGQDSNWHLYSTGEYKNYCSDETGCVGREYTTCSLSKCPAV
eukprot:CAMPEP_0201545468 /NCGR_PEP_ID=MMETSP0173_2-20130828/1983_1 /ASSEMBLY_ACC=CAM_ASM_000268 /TAXON_ID=218659 /ORGANISM="Vexillifera sp., Strain DIVA3 564/2" /LENGTH=606 /DNA_ID=CAMNT_0047953875 /DNA_START=216 /DNA_END=2036 /DNA_ORIENTATION=+